MKKEVKFFFLFAHILFWAVLFGYLFRSSGPLSSVFSIHQFKNNFYEFKFENKEVKYLEQNSKPIYWKSLDQIPKKVWSAFIVSEDGTFFKHNGYDLEQLQKVVIEKFLYKKKKTRGASTITQQLIKNLYLTRDKSITRKAKELYLATMLEKHATKEKILETYLNVIEYGEGIYGIENASQFYFKKSVSKIGPKEAAFLAMLLPSPIRYSKSFKQKYLTAFAASSISNIMFKMRQAGYISENELINEESRRLSFEKIAPPTLPNNTESEELVEGDNEYDNA